MPKIEEKTYHIPVVWESWGVMKIKAKSLNEAMDKAIKDAPLPKESHYVEDSIQIDYDGVYERYDTSETEHIPSRQPSQS